MDASRSLLFEANSSVSRFEPFCCRSTLDHDHSQGWMGFRNQFRGNTAKVDCLYPLISLGLPIKWGISGLVSLHHSRQPEVIGVSGSTELGSLKQGRENDHMSVSLCTDLFCFASNPRVRMLLFRKCTGISVVSLVGMNLSLISSVEICKSNILLLWSMSFL